LPVGYDLSGARALTWMRYTNFFLQARQANCVIFVLAINSRDFFFQRFNEYLWTGLKKFNIVLWAWLTRAWTITAHFFNNVGVIVPLFLEIPLPSRLVRSCPPILLFLMETLSEKERGRQIVYSQSFLQETAFIFILYSDVPVFFYRMRMGPKMRVILRCLFFSWGRRIRLSQLHILGSEVLFKASDLLHRDCKTFSFVLVTLLAGNLDHIKFWSNTTRTTSSWNSIEALFRRAVSWACLSLALFYHFIKCLVFVVWGWLFSLLISAWGRTYLRKMKWFYHWFLQILLKHIVIILGRPDRFSLGLSKLRIF